MLRINAIVTSFTQQEIAFHARRTAMYQYNNELLLLSTSFHILAARKLDFKNDDIKLMFTIVTKLRPCNLLI